MNVRELAYNMALDYFVTNLGIDNVSNADDPLNKHAFEIETKIIMMGPHGCATFITAFGCIIQCLKESLVEWSEENGKHLDELRVSLRNATKSKYR